MKTWKVINRETFDIVGIFTGDTIEDVFTNMINDLTMDVIFSLSDDPSISDFIFDKIGDDEELEFCDPT